MKKMTNKMAKKAMGLKGFMNSMSGKPKMSTSKKYQKGGGTLTSEELESLAHQKRGMGTIDKTFVKKAGPIKNELGRLNDNQLSQLKNYMDSRSTMQSIYEGLPNLGRMWGKSAADIPKNSQLQYQKKGGMIKSKPKMKKGGFPDLNKDGEVTKADILMGRGVINKPKGQKGMNVMKETKKNATPSIPNSYYQMGGMKEENPLSGMLKESMKEKAMAKKKAMANNAKGKSMPKGKGKKKMQAGGRFMPGYPAPLMAGKDLQSLG